jgi:dTDP-4-dehydrorhamnose 3,5-epimerase
MFGHGYQTLTPEAEIVYVVSEFYTPGCERGLRYNDPALKIQWPLPVNLISDKDNSWELLDD